MMAHPDLSRISSPCVRGKHTSCQNPLSCECRCHHGEAGAVEAEPGGNLHAVPDLSAAVDVPVVPVVDPDAGLEWGAPPRRYGPRKAQELLTEAQATGLRARPGEWAKVKSFNGPASAHKFRKNWSDRCEHRSRAVERYPAEEWEVIARKLADNSSAVWVRYIGP